MSFALAGFPSGTIFCHMDPERVNYHYCDDLPTQPLPAETKVLVAAAMDSVFRSCMFNCVSGQKSYKTIFRETASLGLGFSFLREIFKRFILNHPARFPSSIKEADIIPASVERPL